MAEPLTLVGFRHSVYTWVVRLALHEMQLDAAYVEANPFADPPDSVLARYTALGRVPVLCHGTFRLTETQAILRYLDGVQAGPTRTPDDPKRAARMAQVMGVVDADVYPMLVRQVFAQGAYRPGVLKTPGEPKQVAAGLDAAGPVLGLLDGLVAEGLVLSEPVPSLADLHLAPMLSYFLRVPDAVPVMQQHPNLAAWWIRASGWAALRATDPLPELPEKM